MLLCAKVYDKNWMHVYGILRTIFTKWKRSIKNSTPMQSLTNGETMDVLFVLVVGRKQWIVIVIWVPCGKPVHGRMVHLSMFRTIHIGYRRCIIGLSATKIHVSTSNLVVFGNGRNGIKSEQVMTITELQRMRNSGWKSLVCSSGMQISSILDTTAVAMRIAVVVVADSPSVSSRTSEILRSPVQVAARVRSKNHLGRNTESSSFLLPYENCFLSRFYFDFDKDNDFMLLISGIKKS
jgi:hypothetical protein